MEDKDEELDESFRRFFDIVKTLRSEGGCPWDKEQTPFSMRHGIMEECYEVLDAIGAEDAPHVKEEMGDALFNILLTAYMYEQGGDFKVSEVFDGISDKLVRRHPHVFTLSEGRAELKDSADSTAKVLDQWDRIKENVEGRKSESVLDSIPEGFPPLLKAYKMLSKASKNGFEWTSYDEVEGKVMEEWNEVKEARNDVLKEASFYTESTPSKLHLEEEIGDLLLSVVNLSRWCSVDPSIALDKANRKFRSRYTFVEKSMKQKGLPQDKEHLEDMMSFWNEAKKR